MDDLIHRFELQDKELAEVRGELSALKGRPDNTLLTIVGALVVALIAAAGAIYNQNLAAKQAKLVKIVEIVMGASSGWQARRRLECLAPLLDEETKTSLNNALDSFSGPESNELRMALAESMSERATSVHEVHEIWAALFHDKGNTLRVRGGFWVPSESVDRLIVKPTQK